MPEVEVLKVLADQGATAVLFAIAIFLGYRLINRIGTDGLKLGATFICTQQQMADSMSRQAQSMYEMKDSIASITARENSEHREILLSLQVVGRELRSLRSDIKGENDEHPER